MPAEDDATIRQPAGEPRIKAVPPPQVEWGRPAPPVPPRRRGPALTVLGSAVLGSAVLGSAALGVVLLGLGAWWVALRPLAPTPRASLPAASSTPVAPALVAPAPVAPAPVASAPIVLAPISPGPVSSAPAVPDLAVGPQSTPAPFPSAPIEAPLSPGSVLGPLVAPQASPAPDSPPVAAPGAASRLARLPPLLDEAAIRAHRAPGPVLLRLASDPAVFVIDYPTLEEQGAAMNRVAALLEKAGFPRDRVVSPQELADAIAAAGDTPASFYYGHNYRGAGLARFFETAQRDGQALSPAEAWVRTQFLLARGLVPAGQEIMLISLTAPGPLMDETGRATILHHEISHGYFGTRPAYAAHIRRVWQDRFSEAERAALRGFLARDGYDTGIEEMMIDEAQAYLLNTPDPRFFTPAHIGMDAAQVERLRGLLRDGMPQP